MEAISSYIALFFFASEMILLIVKRSRSSEVKIRKDKSSMLVLWIVIFCSIFLGMTSARFYPRNGEYTAVEWAGIIVIILGVFIRWVAIYQLGKAFTVDVSIAHDHKIKNNGLYTTIRHPSYLGLLMEFLGLSLMINSWFALLIINVPIFFALAYRIKVEEELLINAFGAEYENYRKHTKKIVPGVY